ncbi:MAG: glutaredoxin family protein [Rhizobiaceae bacterium]
MQIEIFTGPSCSYCDSAKMLLDKNRIEYNERNVGDPEIFAELQARLPRVKSIPQIFIEGDHVGGFEDLKLLLESIVYKDNLTQ